MHKLRVSAGVWPVFGCCVEGGYHVSAGLRAGYKQTEVGVIPEDWDEFTVGELIEFQGGSQPEKSAFSVTPRPGFVRLIQIRDYKSDKFEVFAPRVLLRRFCDESDIMIGRYGPPVFQILRGLSGAYNVALIKACPRPEIDRDFAYYFLKQESLFEFIDKLSRRSSGQTGVDLSELRRYPLPLPPLPEQRAIAAALSDVDALLGGLDSLIAKKQSLKVAAMQQLLTGQTRLPGFSGVWDVKQLGNVAEIVMGQSPSSSNYNSKGDGLPLIQGNADIANRLTIRRMFTTQITKRGKTGDILMSVRAPVGEVSRATFDVCLGRGVCAIRFPNNFLYHCLIFLEPNWAKHSKGSTFDSVNSADVSAVEIRLPSDSVEQTAIAAVLSDMDAELAALQARRSKTQALKQAMMQELLTGRIRLI